jgi:peptide/nickel transport system ATP-binding protein
MTEAQKDDMVLDVKNLQTVFFTNSGLFRAVDDVSFTVRRGETLAIVGESGCGKSVTALSVMRLVPDPPGRVVGGSVTLEGTDLLGLDEAEMRKIRGNRISMIFQEPMTSLNPVMRIGDQITEVLRLHREMTSRETWAKAVEMLRLVRIPEPERRALEYPHQLSGGMRQRAMIAMALACRPALLIADEPTTALDVTIQAQILRLIARLQEDLGMAVVMITHDLGVIAEVADDVLVMYGGRIVESGTLDEIFYNPQHPYTWGLLGSLTRIDRPRVSRLAQIQGQPPSLVAPPQGCHFRPRCPHAFDKCTEVPGLEIRGGGPGHEDRCWLTPEQKKTLRVVESGEIGLEAPAA